MDNNNNNNLGAGCLTTIIISIVILVLLMIGGGKESEYERAGKEFGTWTKKDPSTWTDTQRQYMDDFLKWSDKN